MTEMPVFNDLSLVKEFYARRDYSEEFPTLASTEEYVTEEKHLPLTAQDALERRMLHKAVGGATLDEIKAVGLGYVDTDPDPSPKPGARRLRRYWTRGPGAAKIRWGVAGDFKRCVRQLREHVGAGAEGLCQVYHKSATGHYAGKGPHLGKSLLLGLEDGLGLVVSDSPLPGDDTTDDVLAVGYRFKVLGPDAVPYTAQVVNLKAIGDRADVLPVAGPMSHLRRVLALGSDEPVALLVKGTGPEPALASAVAVEEKSFLHGWSELAEGLQLDPSSLLVVVPGAEALGEDGHGAVVKSADVHTMHNSADQEERANVQLSDLLSVAQKSMMYADTETKNLVVEDESLRLENLFLAKSMFDGWERVEGKAATYDVGYNVLTEKWEAHDAKNFNRIHASANDEASLYKTLNGM